MGLIDAKVYFDGSHYIAIPQGENEYRPKRKNKKTRTDELREKYNELYQEHKSKSVKERRQAILEEVEPYFRSPSEAKIFVAEQEERMKRNAIVRKMRLSRKMKLQEWNYFCTFTYDDKKHNEDSFKQSLSNCLRHLSSRNGWKYIGAWERSPISDRLHFHCIAYIPDGKMIGEIICVRDYDIVEKRMQETFQNSRFLKRFGRNDFKSIHKREIIDCIRYLIKYIEKSGGRLVYSKGLPTYFKTQIDEKDVVCTIGQEDKKLLLFDNFACWFEGINLGRVSKEVIEKLPKSN